MSRFSSAVNFALARVSGSQGESAVYRRGATSVGIVMVWGASEVAELVGQGSALQIQLQDAIITDHAALRIALGDPRPGDEITIDGRVYAALPAGGDLPCWRWMGQRHALRIHLKLLQDA